MECGAQLTRNESINPHDTSEDTFIDLKCPLCKSSKLKEEIHKGTLGIGVKKTLVCPECGVEFDEKGDKYKLSRFSDHNNETWIRYKYQSLTRNEWARITNGGVSNAEQDKINEEKKKKELKAAELQHEKDINSFISKLQKGMININTGDYSPIIPQKNEKTSIIMNNISLLEPRSVRNYSGAYGGPTIHVAKGVSFRLGGVSGHSESHEEIKPIDKGTLVLTNKRLIFIGTKRTTNIDLRKIVAIKPYKDGIESQRSNKQKSEYFVGTNKSHLTFTIDDRHTNIPINGVVLKAAIMGNISKL